MKQEIIERLTIGEGCRSCLITKQVALLRGRLVKRALERGHIAIARLPRTPDEPAIYISCARCLFTIVGVRQSTGTRDVDVCYVNELDETCGLS